MEQYQTSGGQAGKLDFVNQEAARAARVDVSFSFGRNWRKFLRELDPERVQEAKESLKRSFGMAPFMGERFIDVGCGSGLFSLCAAELGASPVVSIDVDPNSVACTETLRQAHAGADWAVVLGSVLDEKVVMRITPGTRVFSWGALHHTGAMWRAIENTLSLVAPGGLCCLALYNRPGHLGLHLGLKKTYNRLPRPLKPLMRGAYGSALLAALLLLRRRNPVRYVRGYKRSARGMSFWRDVEDWLGGLPFEVTSPEALVAFVRARGFTVENVMVRSPGANNEYLLRRPL